MKKLKILVCGTTFGRFYIQGIKRLNDLYELAGILSNGSKQSRSIAEKLNVPLYTDISKINKEKADVACVVIRSGIVGGKGTDIAIGLLDKGIHVIQEQPIYYNDIARCYKAARRGQCLYFVNTFYPYLSQVGTYLSLCEKVLKKTEPCYISAECSLQVLYPMIDIVGRICEGYHPFKIYKDSYWKNGLFDIFCGEIKGIPYEMKIQNQLNGDNPDNYFHLLHRISLYTEAGSLRLTETNGVIIWNPRYIIPKSGDGVLDPYLDAKLMTIQTEEVIPVKKEITVESMYEEMWPDGICNFMRKIYGALASNTMDARLMMRNLDGAKIWNEIGSLIGRSENLPEKKVNTFSISGLLENTSDWSE